MKLIDAMGSAEIYETESGRGVLLITAKKSGNNAAIFATVGEALSIGLAVAWGGSVRLTHRLKRPATVAA